MYRCTVKIDVTPGGEPAIINISQYDKGSRTVDFELYAKDAEFEIPSGATAAITGTKPDGNGFSYAASLEGNVVTVEFTEQMAAIAGRVPCKLTIESGGTKLLTEKFIIKVDRAALDKDTLISGSEIRELVEIEDRADEIIAAAREISGTAEAVTNAATAAVHSAQTASGAASEAAGAATAASSAAAKAAETKGNIDVKAEKIAEDLQSALAAISQAKELALGVISDKASDISQMKSSAEATAASALSKANNLQNEFEEVANTTESLKNATVAMQMLVNTKADDGYADPQGYLQLTANGEDVGSRIGPFATGGGGGGGGGDVSKAVLTVTNTTGWLSKTISSGATCPISLVWTSIEDEMPTGDGTLRITNNGAVVATLQVAQGEVIADLAKYANAGSNVFRVQIADCYGNSRTINFTVTVIALSLSSTFDVSAPFEGVIQFPYTPVGAVAKTVRFILDGKEIGTQETSVSGRQMTYTIPAQSHGGHSLRVYFESEINSEIVRSNELYYEFISIEELNDDTIITSSFNRATAQQYETLQIPYIVYDPSDATAEVVITANGDQIATLTVDRTQQSFAYRANTAGALTITIESGGTTKTFALTVEETEIDVEPETQNLALYLSSQGRSNQSADRDKWEYEGISADLSGFNWTSDGWQPDSEGITVMRVAGDARITIPYKPFASDFRATGKTIEVEFATRNVMDYDAEILSCVSDGRGLSITAQSAKLTSEQSEISTQYKEDEHIRVAFVAEKRSENRLLHIYINGIDSGCVQYPTDDDFSQASPVNISIGSSQCTMDIYCIRIYDNDLTPQQIVENWIADTQVGATMLERYTRNNVYDAYGNVVISKLPSDLPYMILVADELPQYKGDKKTISGSYTDPAHPAKSFTFTGAQCDVQGTSSQYYPVKNYKIKFKGGFVLISGTKLDTYEINSDAIGVSTFCFKADVASSEGANNVELARLYDGACPYKTPAQEANAKVRQGIDGFPIVIFWNDGNETVFLGKYNFNNDKSTEKVFGFSLPDESWEIKNNTSDRVLWKSADFESEAQDESGKTIKAWTNDFEARYPDEDPAYEDAAQLKEFATWAVSTDRTQATGDALEEAVTYDGVTYTNDTADYRLAKFKAEAGNYMELDSAFFYYLFTELFLMVDSRAKNAFPSFIGEAIVEG